MTGDSEQKTRLKIPFDSLTLAAVVAELQAYSGGKVQRINQPDEWQIGLGIYANGREAYLLLSSHPQFARAHFSTRRFRNPESLPSFCGALRARIDGTRMIEARQIGLDRILELKFEGAAGSHTLIAELMGRNSNLILVDGERRIQAAARWAGPKKSVRPIQSGTKYVSPPGGRSQTLLDVKSLPDASVAAAGDPARPREAGSMLPEGVSPFLVKLIEAMGPGGLEQVQVAVRKSEFHPTLSPGNGAYPLSVSRLGLIEVSRESISVALEQHFDQAIIEQRTDSLRSGLVSQLSRVKLAREVALGDLYQARDAADRAAENQLRGELILAYGHSLPEGALGLETEDYEGKPISVPLHPDMTFLENANRYFDKARHAKDRIGVVLEQINRLELDLSDLDATLTETAAAEAPRRLEELHEVASRKRWLHKQPPPSQKPEERPYQGHRIRELLAPGGFTVLHGENAESNDFLTLRVAKPNDWWLHIRGNPSAHVVIVTKNQPEKVGREALMFAAKIAVQNSPSKHGGFVPVDYTLKKYVRKLRGAQKGSALYTHEKTLHVEG